MLKLEVTSEEYWDESANNGTGQFKYTPGGTLLLEHSLSSLSKWETFYEKPFLSDDKKTTEETIFYIKCMTIEASSPDVYDSIGDNEFEQISAYINKKNTATFFNDQPQSNAQPQSSRVKTAELIYYWMVSLNIPFECENWPLNKLIALIRICQIENQPPSKMSREEIIANNKRLNAERRAKLGSSG